MTSPSPSVPLNRRLRQRWQQLALRERRLVLLATAVVIAVMLWWVLLAPAITTLRKADAERTHLSQQLALMRSLQAQAAAMQQQPAISQAESQQQLQRLCDSMLGANSMYLQGPQATITLNNVSAAVFSEWLLQARTLARAVPQQTQLAYSGTGWSGTLVMQLP
ncbi:MAG: type II secretion system protein GspM [Brachymonas sp.]|nr:type II secretion system protein GspM [Brachymonas sp.]